MNDLENEVPLEVSIEHDGWIPDVRRALRSIGEFNGRVLASDIDGSRHQLVFDSQEGKRQWLILMAKHMAAGTRERGNPHFREETLLQLMGIPIPEPVA